MTNRNEPACHKAEDRNRIRKDIEEQLRFERLLVDLSARFVAAPCDLLDHEIRSAQRQICEFLGIDVCSLWLLSADSKTLILAHLHTPPEFNKHVPEIMDAREVFPWCLEKMLRKEVVVFSRLTDVPPTAVKDCEAWKYYEIEANLTLPLSAGGGPTFGALNFCVLREEKEWTAELINRLRLVTQIFSSVLTRKIYESNLRESEARLKLAADSANAGLWSWDYKTGKIWVTEKTRSLYGLLPDEEVTGDRFFSVLHPDDLERMRLVVEQSFRDGAVIKTEYRIVLPDKSCRWISVGAQTFMKPSGEPDRMMGVSLDITESKRNELERARLRLELSHITRVMTMSELSASLAHEINQPLGAILNNASAAKLLVNEPDKKEEVDEILADIIRDAKR